MRYLKNACTSEKTIGSVTLSKLGIHASTAAATIVAPRVDGVRSCVRAKQAVTDITKAEAPCSDLLDHGSVLGCIHEVPTIAAKESPIPTVRIPDTKVSVENETWNISLNIVGPTAAKSSSA